jgi:hypothetical protein
MCGERERKFGAVPALNLLRGGPRPSIVKCLAWATKDLPTTTCDGVTKPSDMIRGEYAMVTPIVRT